ncbi:MAG TPA: hypothetical protein VLA58_08215, partial [Chitinophagaceae bacterium]|nr:hypothetical protein [Chitinophagaceae bacterium]
MKVLSIFSVVVLLSLSISAQAPIEGRWDLTVDRGDKLVPSWLEVHLSGVKMLVGHFVADGGSARPVARVNFDGKKFSFAIPPQWERAEKDLEVEGVLEGGKITGTMNTPEGKKWTFTGVRAPELKATAKPVWGAPIALFNGKNTAGWHASGAK